ncbi:1,6-anhydro-N-acetylmuramyl-L-alanine amidase AmpD [Alkanindiges sp. WGS2144]|uniref:1,6-anhydro-N-acetylmuramyl-L-alanine amidase AmpD n=1 Tax=Alkanindiges sp. WGS2144 TaxID=3366808 RepID=UPI00375229E1
MLGDKVVSIRHVPSPNFNQRPADTLVRLIVLHNISLPPGQFAGNYIEQFFQNQLDPAVHPYFQTIAELKVSAHVLILRSGEVIQFVSFDDRAWHAGRSSYLGVPECNDYSIGIELEGTDDLPFTAAQYQALIPTLRSIQQAYPRTRYHLAGHSDIAPGRKTDPGDHLDWQTIRRYLVSER